MNDEVKQTQAVAVMTPHRGAPIGAAKPQAFSLAPTSLAEAKEYANVLATSGMVPKDYENKADKILVAVQMGAEIGLKPLQALQNIAVINGRPSVWGDSAIALARAHPDCIYISEGVDGAGDARKGWCETQRRGAPSPERREFSVADARKAGLWGKAGPWTQYPDRMLQLRARGFCIRDVYPDALKGLAIAEEVQDIPVADYRQVEPTAARPSLVERIQGGGQAAVVDAVVVGDQPEYDVAAVEKRVLGAADMAALIALGESCQMAPAQHKDRLRKAYQTRKTQLDAAAKVKDAPVEGEVMPREPGEDG